MQGKAVGGGVGGFLAEQRPLLRSLVAALLFSASLMAFIFFGARTQTSQALRDAIGARQHVLQRTGGAASTAAPTAAAASAAVACADASQIAALNLVARNASNAALEGLLAQYAAWAPAPLEACSAAGVAAAALPLPCSGRFLALVRAYASWRETQLAFLRAARGDVNRARELHAAGGGGPPLSLAVYGPEGGGVGDRFPAIVALFAFALRYQRVFFLHWPDAYGLLESPWLDWRVNADELPLLAGELQRTFLDVRYGPDGRHGVWDSAAPAEKWSAAAPISPYLVTNRGVWSYTSHGEHIDFFSALVEGVPACLHQTLLRPAPAVLTDANMAPVLAEFAAARAAGRRVLGLHFRGGDATMEMAPPPPLPGAAAQAEPAALPAPLPLPDEIAANLNRALSFADAHANGTVLFFVADSARARAIVRARYPTAIVSATVPRHTSAYVGVSDAASALRSTLVDWWLLAQTDARLGDAASGFARAAVLASATGVHFADGGCLPCCGERELFCHKGLDVHFMRNVPMNSGSRRTQAMMPA
jgi:hypothetical protein